MFKQHFHPLQSFSIGPLFLLKVAYYCETFKLMSICALMAYHSTVNESLSEVNLDSDPVCVCDDISPCCNDGVCSRLCLESFYYSTLVTYLSDWLANKMKSKTEFSHTINFVFSTTFMRFIHFFVHVRFLQSCVLWQNIFQMWIVLCFFSLVEDGICAGALCLPWTLISLLWNSFLL